MNADKITGRNGTAKQVLSEEYKDRELYLKTELDNTILSCSDADKKDVEKAYIIRNGRRPIEKFKFLAEAYGIALPAKIRHIPVLKTMFDAIAAINQSTPLDFSVTSRDIESIKLGQDELKEAFVKDFVSLAKEQIQRAAEFWESDKRGENPAPPEKLDEQKLKKLLYQKHETFKSTLEISGQDFLESMIQRLEVEVMNSIMIEDLMASGSEYYQVKPVEKGKKPLVRVINPLNIYYRKDKNKKFLRDHNRVMYKEKVSLYDLLMNHGHKMDEADIKRLLEEHNITLDTGNKFWNMREMGSMRGPNKGQVSYEELFDSEVTLYYGEWMANTEIVYEDSRLEGLEVKYEKKRRYRKDRYEGYRVNDDIYFGLKKSDFIYRPSDDPYNCYLTFNGASYNDRNGEPYSLVLNTEDIADKIDLLHYLWESMIAMSGNKAAMIPYKAIPTWLNPQNQKDRVIKWIGLAKQGAAILDPNQPGAGNFNNAGQLDFSIDQSISVILDMIKYLEEVAGNITGVSRQLRGSITNQDLNGTTKMAVNGSSLVLMPFFFVHNSVMKQMLTDIVNSSRLVYENGFTGAYVTGDVRNKMFSIDNEKFWLADFDVWLSNSGDEMKSVEELKALSIELIKANMIDAVDAIDMNTIKSLTKIKESLKRSVRLKEDNEVEKLASELEQVNAELQKVMNELNKVDQAKIRMQEREQMLREYETRANVDIRQREIALKEDIEPKELDLEKRRVELEAAQLTYSNNAKEIRNV